MKLQSSRVREEEEEEEEEEDERRERQTDIISNLPDCLLSHILSFLPIRDSAATSVLSSRWRHLWILVPILDLDLYDKLMNNYFWNKERTLSFMDTVSMIFSLRKAIPNPMPLHKLRLHGSSSYSDPSYFDTCLQDIITIAQLQELDLDLYFHFTNQPLELPRSVFFCTTLVVLKLDHAFLLNPPPASTFLFPSLKILQLQHIYYADGDSLSTLLAACPVLQELNLILNCFQLKHAGKFNIIVLVPTLKRFFISFVWVESSSHKLLSSYKLHINTPALKYLRFIGPLGDDVVLENLPNLVESVVNIVKHKTIRKHKTMSTKNYAKRARDFMGLLYNVVSMELYMDTLQIILYNVSNDDVPKFHNLSTLKLYGWLEPGWNAWHAIRLLLCRAPKLQTLALRLRVQRADNCSIPDSCLEKSMDVPECLSSHLTTCHYKVFSGYGVEMKLVKLILKAAKVLKTMRITVNSSLKSKVKLQVQNELSSFHKSSQTCQIAFDYENL